MNHESWIITLMVKSKTGHSLLPNSVLERTRVNERKFPQQEKVRMQITALRNRHYAQDQCPRVVIHWIYPEWDVRPCMYRNLLCNADLFSVDQNSLQ